MQARGPHGEKMKRDVDQKSNGLIDEAGKRFQTLVQGVWAGFKCFGQSNPHTAEVMGNNESGKERFAVFSSHKCLH